LNAWNDIHSLFGDPVAEGTIDAITPVECLLVVDSGYSHTTITPVYRGQLLQRAIRRLEIGGKHLTNYIKEMISIRQFNMVDETRIMNDVKETACYVSLDFYNDMERTWKGNRKRRQVDTGESIVVDYVLPNPTSNTKGFLRPHDPLSHAKQQASFVSGPSGDVSSDALVLGNERFTVPEILFNPRDIGMKQAGIPEIILESLSVLPTGLHPAFLANVLAVGGNSLLPGFTERL
jgi:actin-related protein 6